MSDRAFVTPGYPELSSGNEDLFPSDMNDMVQVSPFKRNGSPRSPTNRNQQEMESHRHLLEQNKKPGKEEKD